jgi:hypothetical protein
MSLIINTLLNFDSYRVGIVNGSRTIKLPVVYLLFHMVCIDINFSVITSAYIYDWVNTSAGGVLIPEGIIRPVVNASALTWFIRYIYY